MKQLSLKLLLVSLLVFPAILTFAQSLSYLPVQKENYKQVKQSTPLKSAKSIFTEDFSSGTFPPDGWTINGDGQYNWSAWNNSYAGGTAPECRFNWYPSFNGNSKLVSPVIATSEYLSLELDFQHFLDDFSGGYDLKVETTSDGGTTWNEAWSVTPTGDIGPETVTVLINNSDVGSDNFQFAITFDGYTNIDGWYLDNIVLIDAEAATFNVTYIVKDVYDDPIEGAEIVMDFNGTMTTDASGEAVFADVIAGTYNYVITASDFLPDSGSVTVTDTDVTVDVVMADAPTVLLSEDFTAGLCPPANWTVTPSGTGNWVINMDGGYTGGTGPEGKFYYFPPFTGTTRMITPPINTSAFATLELEFKHHLQGANNSDYSFKVETTSDGGTTWNEVWSVTPAGNIPAETVTIAIENGDVGSPNFQFCLTYVSTVDYGAWHYYFDDIILTSTSAGSLVYSVTYNVKDEDENPIEGAQITMGDYGTLSTDATGQAVYNEVAPETYSWDINAGGAYVEQSGTVTVVDADVVVDVDMETLVPVFPFAEDFSNNTMPPEEWTIVGGADDNWNTLNSSNAGGTAPEAAFASTPNFNGNSKLVSPVLSSTGVLSLMLDFKHYVDDIAGSGYSLKVETTSDGGTTWNEVWSVSPTGNIGPEDVSILIENDDVGSENFQFAFTFDGNSSQVNNWYFDNIHLEVAMLSNLIMEEFPSGEDFPPDGWNIIGGSANWGKSFTSNAGGESPEIYFAWGPPYYTGTSRLMTPTMSTYNYTSLKLQFNYLTWTNADYGYTFKVETSGDGGATWNEIWTITPIGTVGPEVVTLLIDNADVGSDNFKLAMTFQGNSGQINYWYVDNIYLTDGAGSEVYPVTYIVKDEYENPIGGAVVNMEKNGLRYTDPSGQVTYENVFPGTYTCSISKYLFETEIVEDTVTNEPVTVDVEMEGSLLLLYEHFGGIFPPTTWTTFGDGQDCWYKSVLSTYAGGEAAPELYFNPEYNPFTGNAKFVSPEIVTTDYSALFLDFKHTVFDFPESEYSLKVETTSDGGTTWNEVWSISPDGNIVQEAPSLFIETADVGSDIFQFAFTFEGISGQIEKWYIDDVYLSAALAYDAGVVSIDIPDLAISGTVIDPTASVTNTGYETVTFDVTFEIIDGTAVYSELFTVTDLAPLETEIITFPAWTAVIGNYVVEVSTNLVNDENPANDMLSQTLGVASGLVPKKPLYEVFTSSTCPPCPAANEIIDGVLEENPGEWTLIKYQMNWPGAGDPYYTAEGGVRRDYYGVASVPDLYVNSDQISPAGSLTQAIFDQYAAEETALEIDITEASIDDDNIVTVSTDLTSIVGYAEGLTAHIVVVEKLTTGNVGTNGEEEFHYVMMKMLPDASGTTLDALTSGVPVTLTESSDMDDTNMEEPDDLAVIVFVQDDIDKSVVQSEMLDVTDNINPNENLSLFYEGEPFEAGGTITLQDNDTVVEIVCEMAIQNDYSVAKDILVSKEIIIDTAGHTNTFCWGLCFAPNIFVSPDPITLEAGELNDGDFSGHLEPLGLPGTTKIKYTFFEEDFPEVEVHFFVEFIAVSVPLAPPSDLIAEVDLDDVTLSWTSPSSGDGNKGEYPGKDLLSFNIYREGEIIGNTSETTYLDENLSNGTYEYYVTAVYDEGESEASNEVSVGIGVAAINVTPMEIVFDTTEVNYSSEEMFTITNQGTSTLEVFSISSNNAVFTTGVSTLSIEPGNSEEVIITFAPTLVQLYEGEITIESNDPVNTTVVIEVSGVGNVENPTPAPTDLTAAQVGEDIELNWVAPNSVFDNTEDFIGYKVYYSLDGSGFDMIAEEITETTYTHIAAATIGLHTYYVTAVYDEGESLPSNEAELLITSIEDQLASIIMIYPNPASSVVNIKSAFNIKSITIYSHTGQVISSELMKTKMYQINTSRFTSGLYFFRIETSEGTINKRVIIE